MLHLSFLFAAILNPLRFYNVFHGRRYLDVSHQTELNCGQSGPRLRPLQAFGDDVTYGLLSSLCFAGLRDFYFLAPLAGKDFSIDLVSDVTSFI
jgi:hypothetical protein